MKCFLRLSETEQQIIKEAVLSIDPQARIYLFSSRAEDTKRAGDIDLLIYAPKSTFKDNSYDGKQSHSKL